MSFCKRKIDVIIEQNVNELGNEVNPLDTMLRIMLLDKSAWAGSARTLALSLDLFQMIL